MPETDCVVAVFHTHEQAEKALAELESAGVGLKSLSIAAKGSIGFPKDSIIEDQMPLKTGEFALLVHGTRDEVATARTVIKNDGYHKSYTVHGESVMAR